MVGSFLICSLMWTAIVRIESRFIFDRVEMVENENYIHSTYNITSRNDVSYLNWNVTLKRPLNLKITVKSDVYILPNTRQSIFPVPRINFCDLSFHSQTVPFLSEIFGLIEKYAGQGLTRCPVAVGFYQLKDIQIDGKTFSGLSVLRVKAKYMFQLQLQDDNGKKPVQIYRYRIVVRFE